jgi:hypothetical protein
VALAVDGPAPWLSFLTEAPRAAAAWATGPSNTASLNGVYARLFTEGSFSRPLFVAPTLARAAWTVTSLALFLIALARLRRTQPGATSGAHAVATWLTLPVLLNPLGWTHVLLLLLAPLAIAARHTSTAWRALLIALAALFSLPRERLLLWATGGAPELPVPPAGGLVLGVHAVAVVALFVLLTRRLEDDPVVVGETSPPTVGAERLDGGRGGV